MHFGIRRFLTQKLSKCSNLKLVTVLKMIVFCLDIPVKPAERQFTQRFRIFRSAEKSPIAEIKII